MKEVGVDGDGDPGAARGDEDSEDELGESEDEDEDELDTQDGAEDGHVGDVGEDPTRATNPEIGVSFGDGGAFDTSTLKDALGNDVQSSKIQVNGKT
jgi:RIO kinase 2